MVKKTTVKTWCSEHTMPLVYWIGALKLQIGIRLLIYRVIVKVWLCCGLLYMLPMFLLHPNTLLQDEEKTQRRKPKVQSGLLQIVLITFWACSVYNILFPYIQGLLEYGDNSLMYTPKVYLIEILNLSGFSGFSHFQIWKNTMRKLITSMESGLIQTA